MRQGSRQRPAPAARLEDAPVERIRNPFQPTPVQAAVAMVDKATLEMDAKWGTDVVQTLVSPELAATFAKVRCRFDDQQEAGDDEGLIKTCGVLVRGLAALDEAATAAGHKPLDTSKVVCMRGKDGRKYSFALDEDYARAAARNPALAGHIFWSWPEVVRLIEATDLEAVLKAKELFKEAAIVEVRKPRVDWKEGDDVPF